MLADEQTEQLLALLTIRVGYLDAVLEPRAHRGVDGLWPIRRGQHKHMPVVRLDAIHLLQQLIDDLGGGLIVSAATARGSDRIDLVDE